MRLLIIITRNENEFAPYWKSPKEPYITNEHSILVLNGENFNNIDYSQEEFGTLIRDKIVVFEGLTNVQEIGIISHGGGEDNPNVAILQGSYSIRFNRKYSSLKESLCVREFNAVLCQGILPLDSVRDIVCRKCDVNDEYCAQSFASLWNYFSGDSLLEARIHLWKSLSLLGVKIKRGQINAQQYDKEIEAIRCHEKIKDQSQVINLLIGFETTDKFHEKMTIQDIDEKQIMESSEFYNQLFPESDPQ